MLFAVLTLSATLLMSRLIRRVQAQAEPRGTHGLALLLGVVIGLAALTRNEAIWLGLVWATRWRSACRCRSAVVSRLIAIPALVAILFYAPWAIRDWIAFGNPLPGQALSNALSLDGSDIFAWQDPPTLSRYLAAGLPTLARAAGRRASATTCSTSCCSPARRCRSSGSSACRGSPASARSSRCCWSRS